VAAAAVTAMQCRCRRPQRPTCRAGGDAGPPRTRPGERRRPPTPRPPTRPWSAICWAVPFCGVCRGAGPNAVRLHCRRDRRRRRRRRSSPFSGHRRSCPRSVLYLPQMPLDPESAEKNQQNCDINYLFNF